MFNFTDLNWHAVLKDDIWSSWSHSIYWWVKLPRNFFLGNYFGCKVDQSRQINKTRASTCIFIPLLCVWRQRWSKQVNIFTYHYDWFCLIAVLKVSVPNRPTSLEMCKGVTLPPDSEQEVQMLFYMSIKDTVIVSDAR